MLEAIKINWKDLSSLSDLLRASLERQHSALVTIKPHYQLHHWKLSRELKEVRRRQGHWCKWRAKACPCVLIQQMSYWRANRGNGSPKRPLSSAWSAYSTINLWTATQSNTRRKLNHVSFYITWTLTWVTHGTRVHYRKRAKWWRQCEAGRCDLLPSYHSCGFALNSWVILTEVVRLSDLYDLLPSC